MPTKQKETAEFIRTLASELAVMAREAKLDSLSYILDVARHEASQAELSASPESRASSRNASERKSKRVRKRAA